jgi:hypothetical protein
MENRVLTLAEVLALPEGERCVIEDRRWGCARVILPIQETALCSRRKAYNKTWRIWAGEEPPAPEEMAKWPWKEKVE